MLHVLQGRYSILQLTFLKNKKIKTSLLIILTALLFALVSFLTLYQAEISHGKIWAYIASSENRFQMMRIEGLYHSMQRHQFFPLINMSFLNGFGYIASIFNSDLLLYPAAILRLIGYSSAQTTVIYFWLMNFLTFGISFLCFYKAVPKYFNSLVFSFVYTLSTYRLHMMLFRQNIGEIGALLFLPIVVLGIYEVFYGDEKHWLYLAFGMTGLVYSQAISPLLVASLIVLIAIAQFKELQNHRRRLVSLLWAVIASTLMSLAYYVPIFEQLHHTKLILSQAQGRLPDMATDFADILGWSFNNTITQPNIGLILTVTALILLISLPKIKAPALRHFSILGLLMLLATSSIMPWVVFNHTVLKFMLYPWRLDLLATILLAIVLAADPLKIFDKKTFQLGLIALTMIFAVSASYRLVTGAPVQMNTYDAYNQQEPFTIDKEQSYLPVGTTLSQLQRSAHKPKVVQGQAKLKNFKQYGTRLSFNFKQAKKAKVDLPIIAYYGFQSTQSSGKVSKLRVDKNNNNLAQVTINGSGKVTVDYFETMAQKVSRRISFLTLLIIIAVVFINKLELVDFNRIEGLKINNKAK